MVPGHGGEEDETEGDEQHAYVDHPPFELGRF
jgi:hypothetical protein